MELPPVVAEAWREWKASHLPTDNFRANNGRALTYGIECDLDHQASYIQALLEAFGARNPRWNFELRASSELRDVQDFRERVEALALPAETEIPLLFYLAATEKLLRAILGTLTVR